MNPIMERFRNSCRTCATELSADHHELFEIENNETKLSDMVIICTSIELQPNDGLPDRICNHCQCTLIASYQFRLKCIETDVSYRQASVAFLGVDNELEQTFENKFNSGVNRIKRERNVTNYEEEEDLNIKMEPEPHDELSAHVEVDIGSDEFIDADKHDPNDSAESYDYEDTLPLKQQTTIKRKIKRRTIKVENFEATCEHCGKMFGHAGRYKRHLDKYDELTGCIETRSKNSDGYPCEVCAKIFPKPSRLKRHIRVHDPTGKPFECQTCKHRFANESNLIRHEIKHSELMANSTSFGTERKQFPCSECEEVFLKQQSLASHMKVHKTADQSDYPCKYCAKTFTNLNSRRKHMNFHDEEKSNKCHICNKFFGLGSHLIDHVLKKHEGMKPFVCPHCNKGFHTSTLLKYHIRVHTGETPYLCSECGKAFSSSGNLSQHLLIHTGEKRFTCNDCPAKFATKGTLKYHLKTHTGEKPYTCELCGRAFAINSALTKHKLTHTGERPIACDMCDKRFRNGYAYKRHKLTHTGEKPYKCTYCDRAFAQSNDLVKHTRSHVGDNTYQCKQCPSNFRLHRELKAHEHEHYLEQRAQLAAAESATNENKTEISEQKVDVDEAEPVC